MAITITSLGSAPVLNTPTVTSGGSLASSTTYYVVVVAKNTSATYAIDQNSLYTSPSNEVSFTTTSTNKSATLTWSAVTGATHYEVLITTTSGNYSTDYIRALNQVVTTNSCTISSLPTSQYQATLYTSRNLPVGIKNYSPLIKITIEGTNGNLKIEDIYNAVVSAGFPDNVYYDGLVFAIHGNIYIDYNATGSLTISPGSDAVRGANSLWFAHCWILNQSANFTVQAGDYASGANRAYNGSNFFINYYQVDLKKLNIYGSNFNFSKWVGTYSNIGSEVRNMEYGEIKGCSFYGVRTTNTDWSYNLVSNPALLRGWYPVTIIGATFRSGYQLSLYPRNGCNTYYDCEFEFYSSNYAISLGDYSGGSVADTYCQFYDTKFTGAYYKNCFDLEYSMSWYGNIMGCDFNYSLGFSIIDENSTPIENANIKIYDSSNNLLYDKTTDSNGEYNLNKAYNERDYVRILRVTATGYGTGSSYYTKDITNSFRVEISKDGYETYITDLTLLKDYIGILTLKTAKPIRYDTDGNPYFALSKDKGSDTLLLKL